MKSKFWIILSFGLLLSVPAHADGSLQVWPSLKNGTFASAFHLEFLTNAADARIFWSRAADATPADGLMYEEPISITRSGSIYFFAFTPEPDIKATKIQKAFFFVESRTGFEHFRIREVQPLAGNILLKNYSKYPLDTTGWKIESEGEAKDIESTEMESEGILTLDVDLKPTGQEILLRAPDGVAKQLAVIPSLQTGEVWSCTSRRSTSCGVVKDKN